MRRLLLVLLLLLLLVSFPAVNIASLPKQTSRYEAFASKRLPPMEILASGTEEQLIRPCVDCGMWTGRFCDYCLAADKLPDEEWVEGQMTPL